MITKNVPLIIENKDFRRCILCLTYPIKNITKEERKLLNTLIFDKSKKYDTHKKICDVEINNYCLKFHGTIRTVGNTNFLVIGVEYPCEEEIGINVLKDNLLYLKEMVYNPLLENNLFSKTKLETKKEIIKNKASHTFESSFNYYCHQNIKLIDENDYLINKILETPDILNDITSEKLTSIYNETISNNPYVLLIGNVSKNESIKIINEVFENTNDCEFNKNYYNYLTNIPKEVIIKEEETHYKNSCVFFTFKLKNIEGKEDGYKLSLVKNLLSSRESNLLFDILRMKENLVYRSGAESRIDTLTLIVWATSNNNNIDKVEDGIKTIFSKYLTKEYIKKKLVEIKESVKTDDLLDKENLRVIFINNISKYFNIDEKSYYENIKDITEDDIIEFIKNKLTLVSIYKGIGEENE